MPKSKRTKFKPAKKKSRSPRSSVRLSATVASRRSQKADLKHVAWQTVELENLTPFLQRQLIVGGDIMVARILMKKGCLIPEHSHYNEQFSYILEGALKFWIDGKEIVVRSGEALTIPRNMPHRAEALEDTVDLDIFHPPRADWINKTDHYLRRENK